MDYPPTWKLAIEGLTDAERGSLEVRMRETSLARGALLYEEGKPIEQLFLIKEGRLKSCFIDAAGREHTGRLFGPGRLLGLVTNLTGTPPTVSIQAIDDVVAAVFDRRDFLDMMRRVPTFSMNIARMLASMTEEWMLGNKVTVDAAPIRLGKVLRDLANLGGENAAHGPAVIRGITHHELASMVGASRTWVSLMLSSFQQQGLLDCGRGIIRIADLHALQEHVAGLERQS